ncbi:MAG: 6-phosphofructokinase [Planctomycetota bacterium]
MAIAKGKALIGQSGGPTCVINQSLVGVVEVLGFYPEVTAIYGARHGVKGILKQDFIDLSRQSSRTLERVADTPGAALGSVRQKPTPEECEQIFQVCRKHDIRYFFYIGGNDSAEAADIINSLAKSQSYELRLFHVPKTIDNDLLVTDHCPGYGSAARFVAAAFMGDNLDTRSLPGIKINIVMGRHAGFLTAASILARRHPGDGPHLVYLPERVFSLESFAADVQKVYSSLGRCLIAVSEGIHDAQGKPIFTTGEKDAFGNVQLSGTGALGDALADYVRKNVTDPKGKPPRVRADTFGYLQRSFPGFASPVDRKEARDVGRAAARFAVKLDTDGSVALRRVADGKDYACETFLTPLASVAKKTKSLSDQYISDAANDVLDGYRAYVEPLVGELPEVALLDDHRVAL